MDPAPETRELRIALKTSPEVVLTKDSVPIGVLYPDSIVELRNAKSLYCLRIRGETYESSIALPANLYENEDIPTQDLVMRLALQCSADGRQYNIIGLVRWFKSNLFEGLPRLDITLV